MCEWALSKSRQRPALVIVNAFDEHEIFRRVLRELWYDLVRPFAYHRCKSVVSLGALYRVILTAASNSRQKFLLTLDTFEIANLVPRNKRGVELLGRVEG